MLHTLLLLVPLKTIITPEFSGSVGVGVTDGEDSASEEEGEFVELTEYVDKAGDELTVIDEYTEDCGLVDEEGMGSTKTK